jgi:hypothetical protein
MILPVYELRPGDVLTIVTTENAYLQLIKRVMDFGDNRTVEVTVRCKDKMRNER